MKIKIIQLLFFIFVVLNKMFPIPVADNLSNLQPVINFNNKQINFDNDLPDYLYKQADESFNYTIINDNFEYINQVKEEYHLFAQENINFFSKTIKFSGNGKYLLGYDANYAVIYEAATGFSLSKIPILKESECDISPDGKFLVYISPEGKLLCKNNTDGTIVKLYNSFFMPEKFKMQISFSKTGNYCAIYLGEEGTFLYDVANRKLYKEEKDDETIVTRILFAENDNLIEINNYQDIVIKNVKNKNIISKFRVNFNYELIKTHAYKIVFLLNDGKILTTDYNGKVISDIKDPKSKFSNFDFISSSRIICFADPCISIWDVEKGSKFYSDNKFVMDLVASPESNFYLLKDWQNNFEAYSIANNKKLFDYSKSKIDDWVYYPNKKIFLIKSIKSSVGIFDEDFKPITFTKEFDTPFSVFENGIYYLDYTFDTKNSKIIYYDFITQEERCIFTINKQFSNPRMPFSCGENTCIIEDDGKLYIYDLEQRKQISSFQLSKDSQGHEALSIVSKNASFITELEISGDKNKTRFFDCKKNKIFDVKGKFINFSDNEKYLFVYDYDSGTIKCYSTFEYNENGVSECFSDKECNVFLSYDDKYMTLSEEGNIILVTTSYDGNMENYKEYIAKYVTGIFNFFKPLQIKSKKNKLKMKGNNLLLGERISTIKHETGALTVFSSDNKKLITSGADDIIRVFSIDSGEQICSFMLDDDNDWITYTPEGYFNGTENGIQKFVHVVKGLNVLELGQLAETFYRPDLVSAKLHEEKDFSNQTSNLQNIISSGSAPIVSIATLPENSNEREITVNFSVFDTGGGIGDVYLSHNGKVIQIGGSTRKFEIERKNKNEFPFSCNITLADGENIIETYATNKSKKVESKHTLSKVVWHGKTSKPDLHVFALGVNDYTVKEIPKLKYAVTDVLSVVESFSNTAGGDIYSKIWTKTLINEEVTKDKIKTAINSIAKNVKPDDVFVLYIAGHGTAYNGDYYFISYDFDGKNIQTAVSKDFILNNCLSKIHASKTVILLDTCNSGAFLNGSGGDCNTAFARLSHTTGQAIIAATSDSQSAIEGYEGHGVFTYVLLDALSGKADFVNDNKVSLLELNLYISNMVPVLSKMKWNHSQNPWFDLRKQDFILVAK